MRSLACASGVALGGHAGLCPAGKAARVKIGGVLRGVLPRSVALRASGGGARVFIPCFGWKNHTDKINSAICSQNQLKIVPICLIFLPVTIYSQNALRCQI